MKDLDFLPDWYKDNQRRQLHVRRQYLALVAVFLLMMVFNVTATYRAGTAAAKMADMENQRVGAEAILHEFDTLTRQVNDLKARAGLIERIDPRVDMAAILAELSRTIGDAIVLRKLDIRAEAAGSPGDKTQTKSAVVRLGSKPAGSDPGTTLERVKFRIVLTGAAAQPADVPDLVCRLDRSSYFQKVQLSFYGNAKAPGAARVTPPSLDNAAKTEGGPEITEFEIICYLANFKELQP